ncbi:hypothetical protein CMI37_13170 [Candidatus Pacearchaeota archaeon]|nr:hypothetical protein [Candidatus Pacearchaeota archaeon]|tara:strand:- start:1223 stop:1750 length:528 start_codon:yes stop_codon:yes gene_type:complete
MLFKLTKDNSVILHKDCYKLCPELKALTEKQMLYVILAYDYKSPYVQLPLEERRRTARSQVYKSMEKDPEKKKLVSDAIEMYMSLQYEPKRETLDTYQSKIKMLERELMATLDTTEITKITRSIQHLMKSYDEVQKEIERSEIMEELEGGGKLSLLEKMQNSRKLYTLHKDDIFA